MSGVNLGKEWLHLICCLDFYKELMANRTSDHSYTGTEGDVYTCSQMFLRRNVSIEIPIIIDAIHGSFRSQVLVG